MVITLIHSVMSQEVLNKLINSDMKRQIYKFFQSIKLSFVVIAISIIFCGCEDLIIDNLNQKMNNEEGLTVTGSIILPGMSQANTRGLLKDTPGSGLKLTIFEFDKGADDEHSFLSNIYNAEIKSTTAVSNNGIVEFSFTLKAATTPKELHLFLAGDYLTSEYGSVASILPTLTVGKPGSEYEAYWGKQDFEKFTNTTNEEGVPILLDEVRTKLTNVPMIRNFAKITVTENLNNFELLGFDIVNVPTSGTIAPWNQAKLEVPNLLDGQAMEQYSTISQSYSGIVPGIAQFRNSESAAKSWTVSNNNNFSRPSHVEYMYEHPYESTRRSYLIVYGKYTDNGTSTNGFYKLDIGERNEATGAFKYYDIIRNFHYNVVITEVLAPGTATVAEAISRAPFNNLIAATETSSMLNVSNGKNMLIVNDTNHIIIDDKEEVEILYRYIEDVTGDKTVANNVPVPVGLEKGAVIKDFSVAEAYTDENKVNWMRIKIKTNPPTSVTKTQSFSIVDKDGLGRTINLILRKPWQYSPIIVNGVSYSATIATGHDDSYQGPPQVISADAGQELTVYFNLPDGLPEAMFPLDFQLEAKNQGIENNKIGTLTVATGPSLFDPNKIAISYIKTLSYNEYLYNYVRTDDSNDVDVNSPNVNHTVRCRFLTITAVNDNNAEIMIHNPYFDPNASVEFTREE